MKIINMIAGPGAGKTTVALGVASRLKQLTTYNIEYCHEAVRDFIYSNQPLDTMKITNHQYSKLRMYHDAKLDFVIQDCSLLNALVYDPDNYESEHIIDLFKEFDNMTFYIPRLKQYNPSYRKQTEEEAISLDTLFKQVHDENHIHYHKVTGTTYPEVIEHIVSIIFQKLYHC